MKTIQTMALLLSACLLLAGVALAEDEAPKEMKKMTGKELFKNTCKACHGEDADAGEYTPMSLIQEQWEEVFEDWAEIHKEVACPKDKEIPLADHLDKDLLKKIKKFCIDHAADSEQPMTCG